MGASKLRVKPALNLGMVIFSAGMTSFSPTSQYALGSTDAEHQRLIRQATWLAAHTERLFRESGIGPRQRVLDLGSGVGDVALIAARLVGPSGEVVGIERDPRSIALAAARMSEVDLRNVSFTQTDAAQIPGDKPFDAAVGRYILMFLPDPISVLRSLSHLVRPGGILAFQEPCWKSFLQQSARLPLWSAGASLLVETFQRSGTNTEMGPALSRVFQEAGLPAPSTHTDTLMGSEQWLPDCLHSLRPKMAQLNLSLDPLGDFETLSERLQAEVKAFNTTAPLPDLVSAWSRKPASPASR
jgi:ubiquinone/menaquinone biosynthesis C-methylase UbiE